MQQRRVAVDGAVIEVVGVERDWFAMAVEREPARVRVDTDHASALAVADASLQVVALDNHVITLCEAAAWQGQLAVTERACCAHVLAGPRVEVGDVGAELREHHQLRRAARRPPVLHKAFTRARWGVLDRDAVVRLVERQRLVGLPIAQVFECGLLPCVDLAMVLSQYRREAAVDESAKGASGLELG